MSKVKKELLLKNIKQKIDYFTKEGASSSTGARYLNAARNINEYNIELSGIASLDDVDEKRLKDINANMDNILNSLGLPVATETEKQK